ncbi:MAG: hypothetical protein KatS3mg105_2216 [Gemmatales bacterium]|nr:MAG: hypothetical protein KatS3mg105_2216 [Gemmatales bacterium]
MPLSNHIRSSREELEQASRRKAAGIYYGDQRLLCRLLGDFLAFVDTRDLMLGPRLVLDGFWEAWVTLAVARHLQPGMWCVDVGANYGYYTLLMAAVCGAEGRVVACEPNPLLAENFLPWNIAVNGFADRIQIFPKAIGDRNDEAVDFTIHEGDLGTSSLVPFADSAGGKAITVPMTTLDHPCADWSRLDLVKIDAEGAESLVWQGMQETLKRFPQAVVVMELHQQRELERSAELLRGIERDGYSLRAINYDGEIIAVDSATVLEQPGEHWAGWIVKKWRS